MSASALPEEVEAEIPATADRDRASDGVPTPNRMGGSGGSGTGPSVRRNPPVRQDPEERRRDAYRVG